MEKANLNYGMPKDMVKSIFEKINNEIYSSGLSKEFEKIENIYKKNLHLYDKEDGESQKDYDEYSGVGINELEESYINDISAKHMKIEIGGSSAGKKYYVLYFEAWKDPEHKNFETEWVESCRCPLVEVDGHDMVSWQFIDKIREMTYMGYVMCQNKEYDFLKLDDE